MTNTQIQNKIKSLIQEGAIFYCSDSGGKDSQAMKILLYNVIPKEQLVFVHADLGVVEWTGVQDHIKRYLDGDTLNVVKAVDSKGKDKTLLSMVRQRRMWPSSAHRQCTSDLKRGPIMKFIRNDMKHRKSTIAVNCMGIRAAESTSRAKKLAFELNKSETVSKRVKRTVYNWLPIFNVSTEDVFEVIRSAGQEPFWAYEQNERLSCVFCIMGSQNDLAHGARKNPELYRTYVELEQEVGHTMFMKGGKPISLENHVGIFVNDLIPTTSI